MESMFKTVDKLIKEYPEADPDDLMVELEQNKPTLDERLSKIGYTRTEALAAAHAEPERRAALAEKIGVENLDFPYVWAELSEKSTTMTQDNLDLILWLMAGGKLTKSEGLSDEELIENWLHSFNRVKEYNDFLNKYVKAVNDYYDIKFEMEDSKLRHPEKKINNADSERVLSLLCDNGHADGCKNIGILRGNLEIISGIIGELSFLKPIKPLIYFQMYVRYRKKLFDAPAFIPNRKKILEYRKYDFTNDNGKNFNQYYTYCRLYSDLKKCFPKANSDLCDTGFSLCSNLAQWWYKIGAEGYERDLDLEIPFTIDAFVLEQFVTCFEESEINRTMNVSSETLIKWRKSNPTICNNARKTVQSIKFSDLRAFADNSTEFCAKLFDQKQLEGDKHVDHDIAWALFVQEVEERFDDLLEDELTLMIGKWILKRI